MFLSVILITIITTLFALLNRVWKWRVCPICAGVSGSWLTLTAGIVFGDWSVDYRLPIAMMMGGTVVGIAFQGEARFDWAKKGIYMWKAPVVVIGMPVAYWLFKNMSLMALAAEILFLSVIAYFFFIKSSIGKKHNDTRNITELEEKMKKCC